MLGNLGTICLEIQTEKGTIKVSKKGGGEKKKGEGGIRANLSTKKFGARKELYRSPMAIPKYAYG